MESPEILRLVEAIKRHLETCIDESPGVREVLNQINGLDLALESMNHRIPVPPAHTEALEMALSAVPRESMGSIADAIAGARDHLHWRVDRGMFYEDPSEIGDGYTHGNMNCELIGPNGNAFRHPDFTMGLFFMVPQILYRDHNHPAPELYLPLTGPYGWRFGLGPWQELKAGSVIWNTSELPHAMRVYDVPFLAIYSWPRDVNHPCRVVHADDWSDLERELLLAAHV